MLIYYLIALVVLTILVWMMSRLLKIKVCPICVAAVITWAIGLISYYLQAPWADSLIVAILLGATLGAVAEKYGQRLGFLWKSLWVILCLTAIYWLVQGAFLAGLGLVVVLTIMTWLMSTQKVAESKLHQDLFKDCC